MTERFVLEDRKIETLEIKTEDGQTDPPLEKISYRFFEVLSGNASGVKVLTGNQTENTDSSRAVLTVKVSEYHNETKTITFSDFISYDILEQQVKIGLEILVNDKEGNLLWKRKASRYNYQRWMDFSRPVIGINPVVEYFFLPSQFVSSMKKQYSDEELIIMTLNEVVCDLAENLVRIKSSKEYLVEF